MSQKTHAVITRTIGIDTGKNTLHLVGLDDRGTIVLREKLGRGRIRTRLANIPPCLIGIEAGMATHYVARELLALGHDVRQVPPAYAKPFRQGRKNDFRDAYAIAEAVQRPSTRFVSRDGLRRGERKTVADHVVSQLKDRGDRPATKRRSKARQCASNLRLVSTLSLTGVTYGIATASDRSPFAVSSA